MVLGGARLILAVAALLFQGAAGATPVIDATEPGLCTEAARRAALRHGIPPAFMQAITLVETRRSLGGASVPWPWTLNVSGEGYWYPTRAEALARAEREIARGRTSVDLGCFQLNFRWHGASFATPDEMLEPGLAADYAARFLAALHEETGDWMRAAGFYHSRTSEHAERYRGLITRALAWIDPDAAAGEATPSVVVRDIAAASQDSGRPVRSASLLAAARGPLLGSASLDRGQSGAPQRSAARRSGGVTARPGAVSLIVFSAGSPLLMIATARP